MGEIYFLLKLKRMKTKILKRMNQKTMMMKITTQRTTVQNQMRKKYQILNQMTIKVISLFLRKSKDASAQMKKTSLNKKLKMRDLKKKSSRMNLSLARRN